MCTNSTRSIMIYETFHSRSITFQEENSATETYNKNMSATAEFQWRSQITPAHDPYVDHIVQVILID